MYVSILFLCVSASVFVCLCDCEVKFGSKLSHGSGVAVLGQTFLIMSRLTSSVDLSVVVIILRGTIALGLTHRNVGRA